MSRFICGRRFSSQIDNSYLFLRSMIPLPFDLFSIIRTLFVFGQNCVIFGSVVQQHIHSFTSMPMQLRLTSVAGSLISSYISNILICEHVLKTWIQTLRCWLTKPSQHPSHLTQAHLHPQKHNHGCSSTAQPCTTYKEHQYSDVSETYAGVQYFLYFPVFYFVLYIFLYLMPAMGVLS